MLVMGNRELMTISGGSKKQKGATCLGMIGSGIAAGGIGISGGINAFKQVIRKKK